MSYFEKEVCLEGGDTYITKNEKDAFRVKDGSVLVYIIPLKGDCPGRRSFLYEANEKEVIPSFFYKDMEYCQWRFCFVAVEKATIEIVEDGTTKLLKKKFAEKACIRNYAKEGYEGGLVDQYRINTVTEDGFIRRTQHQHKETEKSILKLIYNAFGKNAINDDYEKTNIALFDAMAILCNTQKIKICSYEKIKEACGNEITIADIARISHFSYREIILSSGWHKRDNGDFLVFDSRKRPMLCLSNGKSRYILYDVENNSSIPISDKVAESIEPKAFMLYRPLPAKKIGIREIFKFCIEQIRPNDVVLLSVMTGITSLIGLLTPKISQKIYDEYIPIGAKSILFQLGCLMLSFMIANIMFSIVKNLVTFRITTKMSYCLQGAIYDRVFNLPENFLRKYESAELAQYIMGVGNLVNSIATTVITGFVALVFIIVYFIRMMGYSAKMTGISILMITIYGLIYYMIAIMSLKYKENITKLEGKTNSLLYQFISGISKIRIAGVEDRALYEYLKPYVKLRNNEAKKNTVENICEVVVLISSSIFSLILYVLIIKGKMNIGLGSFVAFNTLFGSFSAYMMQIVQGIVSIKGYSPQINILKPIFNEKPELDDAKELPGEISGGIEINNISFAYSEGTPNVIENMNLNIKPGEYVGIVGPSGCGKSTLMKLLLGFEKTVSGKIYYDNKDLESIDKRELRKKMGVVLQDGKLISGSIFENITITSPKSTVNDVKEVIKSVGLENDIKEMPMGLHTILSEDCGTISGGQQQRILIARAIISNPKILFFDEATSALDNITQKMVCETLDKMNSTRIVIAHRLSTIINCDRIIVMNAGRIVEQGNYEELMSNKGLFYQLASRQLT